VKKIAMYFTCLSFFFGRNKIRINPITGKNVINER